MKGLGGGGRLLLEQVSLFLGHSNIHPLFLLYNKMRGISQYLSLLEFNFILPRPTDRRTTHILPLMSVYGAPRAGRETKVQVQKEASSPQVFCFLFPSRNKT